MNFSLKHLFAVTLLAILCVNGFYNRHKANGLRSEAELIKTEIEDLTTKTRGFAEREQVYQRAWSAFEQRRDELAQAPDYFAPVARAHQSVNAKDKSSIHVFAPYSSGEDRNRFQKPHETYRIWIPDSPGFELCLGYHEPGPTGTTPVLMKNSRNFVPAEQFKLPLEPGYSLVEFTLSDSRDKSTVNIKVNGVVVHEAERLAVLSWREKLDLSRTEPELELIESIATDFKTVFDPRGVVLATANMWPSGDHPESLSLVVIPSAKEQ